jgi:hypothetical protein
MLVETVSMVYGSGVSCAIGAADGDSSMVLGGRRSGSLGRRRRDLDWACRAWP